MSVRLFFKLDSFLIAANDNLETVVGNRSIPLCDVFVLTFSSGRQLGDMEVMLSLEDLGPIVQPTVVIDSSRKDVSVCGNCVFS
jgi:hypothetical protein